MMSGRATHSFTTTKWSMVLRAGDSEDPGGREALETLCQRYWRPVYTYIRHRGFDTSAAEDLTQSFFAQLLEKRSLKAADPERGRFRSFLLASVRNFLSDSRDKERAQKRGGAQHFIPLDFSGTENCKYEPAEGITPEALFERQWANSVLTEVFGRLRREAIEGQALERFERLEGFLTGELEGTKQSQVAEELGMNAETLRVAIHRLRKRFGKLLREQVAQTVADPGQVDDEIRFLLTTLNS
jgi:RNA polymerase sigma factor (sigma-70 family)